MASQEETGKWATLVNNEVSCDHPRAPGVAAAAYVSTSFHYPWHIPLKHSSFNVSQRNCPQGVWSDSGHMI